MFQSFYVIVRISDRAFSNDPDRWSNFPNSVGGLFVSNRGG
jgi:hypothetical protein